MRTARNPGSLLVVLTLVPLVGAVSCAGTDDGPEGEVEMSQAALTALNYHGGDGGNAFTTIESSYYGFRVRSGSYIDQLTLQGGYVQGPYGGSGGQDSGWRTCGGALDWIVGVYGRAGSYVDQLGFICGTVDRSRYYQTVSFGGSGGDYFEESCSTGTVVRQISGRSDYYLNGIQVWCGPR